MESDLVMWGGKEEALNRSVSTVEGFFLSFKLVLFYLSMATKVGKNKRKQLSSALD
jgi:preprotein translocase subunit SecG